MKSMNNIIVLFAICNIHADKILHHRYHEFYRECLKEAGVDDTMKDDPKYRCVHRCVYLKMQVISRTGELNYIGYLDELQAKALDCYEPIKGYDSCIRASLFDNCSQTALKEIWNVKIKKCASENQVNIRGIDKKALWKLMTGAQHACFGYCVMSRLKLVDYDNDIDIDTINMLGINDSDLNVEAIVKNCNKEHRFSDICVQVVKRIDCVFKALKKGNKEYF